MTKDTKGGVRDHAAFFLSAEKLALKSANYYSKKPFALIKKQNV